ncbi:MAG: Asp-tRNA(Asn)/Glu-tRNA(Gln) amidotransferase subunit GatC [Brumimicrobium sp.]
MEIKDELIDHIAHLSRLSFEGKERDAIKEDMQNITAFMDKLSELNTDDTAPLIFMSDEVNVLREDIPKQTLSHEEALQNAPKKDSDYFRIPKVLDKQK